MPDTLTVYFSGDAVNGDANATISVNGAQVGTALDVSAVNAQDNVQAFTFTGNFGANPQVSVSFVNQAWSGALARTLYVDGFSYDGVLQLNDKQYYINYDHTVSYALTSTLPIAKRAADFMNAMGVCAHLDYYDTSYGVANGSAPNLPLITQDLAYLGIIHMRVGVTAALMPTLRTLAAEGFKFDILMPSASSTALLPGQIAALDQIAPAIASIEGPNETDITSGFAWNGQSGYAAAAAYQQALWNAVKGDQKLANDPVYSLTLGTPSYSSLGNLSAYATAGSMHVYYANGVPPAQVLQYNIGVTSPATPGRPLVITETNYTTAPAIQGSVNNAVQASYDLDLLMDATADGVATTYFYELLDEHSDPNDINNENHFGLFNADGTPKPAATALHNLTTVLADSGGTASTFTPGSLKYSVSGLPASGNTLLLEKSNGAYDIVVWAEPEIWNATTSAQIAALPRQVTVTLPNSAAVNVYDPLMGTSAIAQYGSTSSIGVTVTDHPVVIEIEPPTPAILPGTLGSGPDVLALSVSEDAFQGDAQFTILIDGKQVGGTLTATANHSASTVQTFKVLSNLGAGTHTVSVDFLNDLYTPGVGDRNLYVAGATIDGGVVPSSSLTLMSGGTQSFSFMGATQIGSGSDVLSLLVSEDAFNGNAQVTVTVDGQQIGGVQSATASHSAGAVQVFDVFGNFAAGTHTVGVNFLNDLYTPGVGDRNLYVAGATFDGTTVHGASLALMSAGTQTFTFTH